jgi:hypothetical protein
MHFSQAGMLEASAQAQSASSILGSAQVAFAFLPDSFLSKL